MEDNKILVILGPTSTGKTDLALKFAKKFNGGLIACDSRQVYVGLDIGTGKLPSAKFQKHDRFWEINDIKIWMYDVVDPKRQYTVYDYVKDANGVINDIFERGKLPIIVGGTGLYLKALLEGLSNLSIPVDKRLRQELDKLSLIRLQEKLKKISSEKWTSLNYSDRQNPRRLIRAIEIASTNLTSEESLPPPLELRRTGRVTVRGGFKTLKIGLTAPREVLYKKINDKVLEWIKERIVDEVSKLIKKGLSKKRLMELGLEYAVVVEYLDKKISLDQMIEKMQNKVRQYAKRQIIWFKKEKEVCWFDISHKNYIDKVENLVAKWYDIL